MLVGYTAEEYVLCQSRNLIAGSDLEVQFHCFCNFYKLILKCQKKMVVDMPCNLQVGNVK